MTFSYEEDTTGTHIGYAIDFGEIKRVVCSWIDKYWDHGFIANKADEKLVEMLREDNNKLYISSLGNPSAENIAKELFYVANYLLKDRGLSMWKIKLYETPNCYVECMSLSDKEIDLLSNNSELQQVLKDWKDEVGVKEYDCRKENICL
jgi:6-pyruvoyltetrahydropterin/6-carboxytetrahydropterin synthase